MYFYKMVGQSYSKKELLYAAIGFSIFILIIVFISKCQNNGLQRNPRFAKAIITELGNSRNAGNRIFLKYKFFVMGNKYTGNTGLDCSRSMTQDISFYMLGREVNVVYQESNPNNCKLLLSYSDFKKYGLSVQTTYDSTVLNELKKICDFPTP